MASIVQQLLSIFAGRITSRQSHWNGRYLTMKKFDQPTFALVETLLGQLHQQPDGDREELTVDLNKDLGDELVFYEREHFLSELSYDRYRENFDKKTISVLLQDGSLLRKVPGEAFSPSNALIINFVHYRNILAAVVGNKQFVSLNAPTEQQMIILSAKYGTYNIGYQLSEKRVESVPDLKGVYEELVKNFDKVEYVNFFKDVVIDGTHTQLTKEVFWGMVVGLGAFLASADRDYQIYVQTFAFDKIQSKFKEEKVKYFESLEKNIDSLNKQVVAFPLTFAASAFAGFQVKDNPWILFVIAGGYALYTWVAWQILKITKFNIDTTKTDVEKESVKIQSSYMFIYDEFKDDFANIYGKISRIETLHARLKKVL